MKLFYRRKRWGESELWRRSHGLALTVVRLMGSFRRAEIVQASFD